MKIPPEDRFWNHVEQAGDCWEWTGYRLRGYGRFNTGEGTVYAHRWSYEYLRDAIPSGLSIDHLCKNPACVNPWHLEPVTPGVNTLRSNPGRHFAARTHCVNGHDLSEALIRNNARICGQCMNDRHRQWRASQPRHTKCNLCDDVVGTVSITRHYRLKHGVKVTLGDVRAGR